MSKINSADLHSKVDVVTPSDNKYKYRYLPVKTVGYN